MRKNVVNDLFTVRFLFLLISLLAIAGSCAVTPRYPTYRFSDRTRQLNEVAELRATGCIRTFRVGPMNELARWRDRYAIKPDILTVIIAECPISDSDLKRFHQVKKNRLLNDALYGSRTAYTAKANLMFVPDAGHQYELNVVFDFSYINKEHLLNAKLTDVTNPKSPIEIQTRAPIVKEVW